MNLFVIALTIFITSPHQHISVIFAVHPYKLDVKNEYPNCKINT